jgi:hypothetical protein
MAHRNAQDASIMAYPPNNCYEWPTGLTKPTTNNTRKMNAMATSAIMATIFHVSFLGMSALSGARNCIDDTRMIDPWQECAFKLTHYPPVVMPPQNSDISHALPAGSQICYSKV